MNDDATVAHGVMFWFFLLDSFKNTCLSNHTKVLWNFGGNPSHPATPEWLHGIRNCNQNLISSSVIKCSAFNMQKLLFSLKSDGDEGVMRNMNGNLFPPLCDSLDRSSPAQKANGKRPEYDGSRGAPIAVLSRYKLSYVK